MIGTALVLAACSGSTGSSASPLDDVEACRGLPSAGEIETIAGVDGLGDPQGERLESLFEQPSPDDRGLGAVASCAFEVDSEVDDGFVIQLMVLEGSSDDLLAVLQERNPDDGWRRSSLVDGGVEGNTQLWVEGEDGFLYGATVFIADDQTPYEQDRDLLAAWGKI